MRSRTGRRTARAGGGGGIELDRRAKWLKMMSRPPCLGGVHCARGPRAERAHPRTEDKHGRWGRRWGRWSSGGKGWMGGRASVSGSRGVCATMTDTGGWVGWLGAVHRPRRTTEQGGQGEAPIAKEGNARFEDVGRWHRKGRESARARYRGGAGVGGRRAGRHQATVSQGRQVSQILRPVLL